MEMSKDLFSEFQNKWLQKGIELQIKSKETPIKGQYIQLLAKPPFGKKDVFLELMTKNAYGVKLHPDFMSEMTGWEIIDGRTVYNDDFIQFAEIIKEFAELTRNVPLRKGKQKIEVTKVFKNNERG